MQVRASKRQLRRSGGHHLSPEEDDAERSDGETQELKTVTWSSSFWENFEFFRSEYFGYNFKFMVYEISLYQCVCDLTLSLSVYFMQDQTDRGQASDILS